MAPKLMSDKKYERGKSILAAHQILLEKNKKNFVQKVALLLYVDIPTILLL